MKNLIFTVLLVTGVFCTLEARSLDKTEHITREFTIGKASDAVLLVYNISGEVKVEGVAGNKLTVEIEKTISADNEKDVETGFKEFSFGFDQKSDSITVYIAKPFDTRPNRHNSDIDIDYEFNADFTIRVPYGMNLHVATVNNGMITISNVSGKLHANNVNESIKITNARSRTDAETVNGDVIVDYASNPVEESSYGTINGDIRITFKPDLSADMQFKSMNGEFFTDFPSAQLLPASVEKTSSRKSNGTVYKLGSKTTVRFGKGGMIFRFETLNGNVYIKKS